jgi:hypothetical protein
MSFVETILYSLTRLTFTTASACEATSKRHGPPTLNHCQVFIHYTPTLSRFNFRTDDPIYSASKSGAVMTVSIGGGTGIPALICVYAWIASDPAGPRQRYQSTKMNLHFLFQSHRGVYARFASQNKWVTWWKILPNLHRGHGRRHRPQLPQFTAADNADLAEQRPKSTNQRSSTILLGENTWLIGWLHAGGCGSRR